MTDILHELAVQQLKDLDASVRLLIIHPHYKNQHMLLPDVWRDSSACVYLCLTGTNLTADDLWSQLQAAVTAQCSLESASLIVLDESDRAQDEALAACLEDLLRKAENARIVLMGRHLPLSLLTHPVLRAVTRLIPTNSELSFPDYFRKPESHLLEVYALGAGQVVLNGRQITDWDGTLPRALFFYLVDRGMVTRNEIFTTFWPALTTKEATNVFHVTKRKITEILGTELTEYKSGFYHISASVNLLYDVSLVTEMEQQSGIASPSRMHELLTSALTLYKGRFLSQMDSEWVIQRRSQLVYTYGEMLLALAKYHEKAGAHDQALGLYLRALETNRQREDIVRSIMELYGSRQMYDDALQVYRRLEAELDKTLGVSPAPSLRQVKTEIETMMGGAVKHR